MLLLSFVGPLSLYLSLACFVMEAACGGLALAGMPILHYHTHKITTATIQYCYVSADSLFVRCSYTILYSIGLVHAAGFHANMLDLAPDLNSVIAGFVKLSSLAGVIVPIFVTHVVQRHVQSFLHETLSQLFCRFIHVERVLNYSYLRHILVNFVARVQEVYEWALTFRVSAIIMVGGALFYGTLASGELQPWSQLYNHINGQTNQPQPPQQSHPPSGAASAASPTVGGGAGAQEEEAGDEASGGAMQAVRAYGMPRSHGGPNAALPLLLPTRDRLRADYASLALSHSLR